MTESKRTPGPWVAGWGGGLTGPTTPSVGRVFCGGDKWGFQPVSSAMETVAVCPNHSGPNNREADETALANARLIAASPCVLAAAVAVLAQHDNPIRDGKTKERFEVLRAAIAKATGQ